MDVELTGIEKMDVWEDYDGPEPANPLNTTWVYQLKDNCHGDPLVYKSLLCVQGFDQVYGLDYQDTFSLTGKAASLRIALLYGLYHSLPITQFDVKGAFLHALLKELVIIKTPKGLKRTSKYLKLKRSLYGLKQAPLNWFNTLTPWLLSQGFHQSSSDPCLYLNSGCKSMIFFHVKNLILVGLGDNFKNNFLQRFPNSTSHNPNTILGMKYSKIDNKILLSQPNHIEHGLEELKLTKCHAWSIPLTSNLNLRPASDEEHEEFKALNINYRSAVFLMNYIACLTQPDISYAVSSLARFCERPGINHWREVKRCWKYLKVTKGLSLVI